MLKFNGQYTDNHKKIIPYLKILWEWKTSFLYSIYFNLRYLPFKQAIKLPIWLNKPHINAFKDRIVIEGKCRPGMIKLGGYGGHMYPNNGIHITQMGGGTIIFKGSCSIGNNSYIYIKGKMQLLFSEVNF